MQAVSLEGARRSSGPTAVFW